MEIRFQPAGADLGLEAQRMLRPASPPVIHIGAEVQHPAGTTILDLELDCEEWRIIDRNPALLHRRDQEIVVAFALEYGGKQLHQRRPADRRLEIEPGAVGSDAHIEIAAERRVPALDRRGAPWGVPRPSAPGRPAGGVAL